MLAEHKVENLKFRAIGPFNPVACGTTEAPKQKYIEWLNKQPRRSVLYVSFSTTTSMSDNQIAVLTLGLGRSGQQFIWVLRDADRAVIYFGQLEKLYYQTGKRKGSKK